MAAAGAGTGLKGFGFRRLGKPEELRAAEELQRVASGGSHEAPVPLPVLRSLPDHGGLVLGAFADIYLAGLSVGYLGWDGPGLYHYVHRFVVRPEYANHGLGRALAGYLRTEVQQQGLESVRGVFDPLSSRSAGLVHGRLGATSDRYLTHYYGQSLDPEAVDKESDRLRFRWALNGPGVEERLAAAHGPPADPAFAEAPAIVETETGESGLRVPTAVVEPTAPRVTLEIPFDIELLREHEPTGARRWRHAVRDAFRAATDLGYVVVGFEVRKPERERRGFYLLEASPPAGSPAPPPA